jgi:hypothetical protein
MGKLTWGAHIKPDRRLPPIQRLAELHATLDRRPRARLTKTFIARTRKRKGGVAYEAQGHPVERRVVEEALAQGRLKPHDAGLFGPDNPQSWIWGACDD